MSDQQVAFWLVTMGVIELAAVFTAILVVFPMGGELHQVLKIGFAVMVFGLVIQLVRTTHYLNYGTYPVDHVFPMWITKDLGASILIFYFAFLHGKQEHWHIL